MTAPTPSRLRTMAARHGVSAPWFQAAAIPLVALSAGIAADRALLGGMMTDALGLPVVLALVLAFPAGVVIAVWIDMRARSIERFAREHRCPRCAYLLTRPGHRLPERATCAECGLTIETRDYFIAFPEARWRLRVE